MRRAVVVDRKVRALFTKLLLILTRCSRYWAAGVQI
jgi:hypothetical protein